MTLDPQIEFSISEETACMARGAYPRNLYMKVRDASRTYILRSFISSKWTHCRDALEVGIHHHRVVHLGIT